MFTTKNSCEHYKKSYNLILHYLGIIRQDHVFTLNESFMTITYSYIQQLLSFHIYIYFTKKCIKFNRVGIFRVKLYIHTMVLCKKLENFDITAQPVNKQIFVVSSGRTRIIPNTSHPVHMTNLVVKIFS